jgi:LmbE family N-acetylglucosaminyl deacetylase
MQPDPLLGRTLVLVAHPDDECVMCGGLLQRISHPMVLFATDGAPHDPYFWQRYGSRERYAEIRTAEARHALHAVGVGRFDYLRRADESFFTDQELFRNLDVAFAAVSAVVHEFRPDAILTLAYEGGHPDHDTCSFLAANLGDEFDVKVWEAPVYHRSVDGAVVKQEFLMSSGGECALELTPGELARKMTMWKAYESQSFIGSFDAGIERFRIQPHYDYTRPPHTGTLNYEAWQWKMTGAEVSTEFARFLARRGRDRRGATAD